jgi:four helix bundle protein
VFGVYIQGARYWGLGAKKNHEDFESRNPLWGFSVGIKSYKDLVVWQESMRLVKTCYRLTDAFPISEEFGLKNQMRRAAVSIPSNIAEGHSRTHRNEYLHSISIALGSLAELETQLELSVTLGFIHPEGAELLASGCNMVGRMLHRLKASLLHHGTSSPQSQDSSPHQEHD